MNKTPIAWTEMTWNPLLGCRRVSPGCAGCYAERLIAVRFSKNPKLPMYHDIARVTERGEPQFTGARKFIVDRLDEPLRRRKGAKVFVCDMGDLFFEGHPFEDIAAVFGVMATAQHHTFQVLTKRTERMAEFFAWHTQAWRAAAARWPLPNVWIGTTVEDQRAADERIPHLLRIPAAVRFLSVEPMLGPVDLTRWIADHHQRNALIARNGVWGTCVECPRDGGAVYPERCVNADRNDHRIADDRIHWVICGGESGPKARPFDNAWAWSLLEQCAAADVAFFMKQGYRGCGIDELPPTLRVQQFPATA